MAASSCTVKRKVNLCSSRKRESVLGQSHEGEYGTCELKVLAEPWRPHMVGFLQEGKGLWASPRKNDRSQRAVQMDMGGGGK